MTGLVLGLDVGSSMAKAGLYDDRGHEVATAGAAVMMDRSRPGRVEFDPLAVQTSVAALIGRVSAAAGIGPADIRGVGIAAAMVGGVLVDAQNRPLRAGINWEDARAQGLIAALQAREPGILSRIFQSSGCVLQQGCTLPVLSALAAEEPKVVARAHAFISLKDHLRAWLTGRIGADRTEAAVAPGSAAARDRSPALITTFGLDALAHLLPAAEDSHAIGGTVTQAAAAATGLRAGTPVAVGAGDVPCTVLGAGGALPGPATVILGTTAMVGVTHAAPLFTPPDLGLLFTLPGTGWFRAMVNVAGTLNLDWALRLLVPDLSGADALAAFETLARQSPPGSNGVVYLPYLSDSGIIAPTVDPAARAAFGGLAPRHVRADLARAVYEGVAYSLTELLGLTGFSGHVINLVGGGARSGLWPQMIADFSGKPVTLSAGHEFGARGAALLASVAMGDLRDMAEAAALAPPVRLRLDPDPALAGVAEAGRQRFTACRASG